MDPFHFDTDPDPDPFPMITDPYPDPTPDPDPGRISTKIQRFKIPQLFLEEKFCGFPLSIKKRLKYSNP